MTDPLADILKGTGGKPKRYNLSVRADLYEEIMKLAADMSEQTNTKVSAAKVIEGCVALYKKQRVHTEK